MRSVLAVLLAAAATSAAPVELSVKLVREQAGRCTAKPTIEAPGWHLVDKPWHNGENDWEVYFELEADTQPPPLNEVTITAPGLKAKRAIVGKTDVPFTQEGDRVHLKLVDDRARGQLMQVDYRPAPDYLPIALIHNWAMRRSWQYLADPYPARQVAATRNWLLMAQELLHRMGGLEPGQHAYRGELNLMDSEVAATRGHMDWPPHVHLMHYEFAKNAAGGTDWVSRLVPHFYMDDQGRLVRNSYAVIAGRGKSGELKDGDVCHFEDTTGTPVLDLILRDGGLVLRKPDGDEWSLRPAPEGPSVAVEGYHRDRRIARVAATDDPEHGRFSYVLTRYDEAGQATEATTLGYRYDPFTGRRLGPL